MSVNGVSPRPSSSRGGERTWYRASSGPGGLRRYVALVRDHWRLMAVLVTFVVAGALLAVALLPKTYEAEALLTVSPVSSNDTRFDGISVIRETSVPGRDVETLARLVKTNPVARVAADSQGVSGSPEALLGKVSVSPIGGSFLVSVSATASGAEEAAAIANAFAQGTVTVRSAQFREQVENAISNVEGQLNDGAGLPQATRDELSLRLAQLQALRSSNDPSVQLETPATVPGSPSTPPLSIVVAIALVVGLIIAFAGAVAVDTASTRVRAEGQISERFALPVLGRVPKGGRGSPGAAEAYRDLAQSIAVLRREPHRARSLLFTSAGEREDHTSVAIETARTLADAGQRVLLVDSDVRRPRVARTLGLTPVHGPAAVMLGQVALETSTIEVPGVRGRLEVLGDLDPDAAATVVALSPATVSHLMDSAGTWADFVIFDGAPLGTVTDSVPVATSVDDVVIVIQRGETELGSLSRLADLLAQYEVAPRGLCLVGWANRTRPGGAPAPDASSARSRRRPRDTSPVSEEGRPPSRAR